VRKRRTRGHRVGDGAGVGGNAGPGASLVGVRVGVAVLAASDGVSTVTTIGAERVGVGVGGVGAGSAMRTALMTIVRPKPRLSAQNMSFRRLSRRARPRFLVDLLADFTAFLQIL